MEIPFFVFVLVWIGQIVILSFVGPISNRSRTLGLVRRYPPVEFPALHPILPNELLKKIKLSVFVNAGAGTVSMIGLLYTKVNNLSGDQVIFIMAQCFALQIVVLSANLLNRFRYLNKALDGRTLPNIRVTDMQTRKLFNFVSPIFFVLLVIVFTLNTTIWLVALSLAKNTSEYLLRGFLLYGGFLSSVIIFIGIFKKLEYIRTLSNQSFKDAYHRLSTRLNTQVFMGIFSSIILSYLGLIFSGLIDKSNVATFVIVNSLGFQTLVIAVQLINWKELRDIDADSYREPLIRKSAC